ncbi:MAG: HAD-IA family hydrolase, partial [Rhodospirillales bacterium]
MRLAVFDCDGTLVDSQHSIVASMFAAFDAHAQPRPDAEAVRHVVGLPLREAIARLIPDGATADCGRLETSYVEAFRALRRAGGVDDPLYPGALDVLAVLEASGWVLGVATGKSSRGLVATLEAHGLTKRFRTLQTADKGPGKPNPDMLLNAMTETGAEPANTVMIGDTTFDMEMARRAGAVAIGVSWGYHPEERLHSAGAH